MRPGLESTVGLAQSEKPILDSYDSGHEFSLYHWVEVCKLIDESEELEIEEAVEITVSEV